MTADAPAPQPAKLEDFDHAMQARIRNHRRDNTIECLVCGALKAGELKRHLLGSHGMTQDQYRARFALPANTPLAPGV